MKVENILSFVALAFCMSSHCQSLRIDVYQAGQDRIIKVFEVIGKNGNLFSGNSVVVENIAFNRTAVANGKCYEVGDSQLGGKHIDVTFDEVNNFFDSDLPTAVLEHFCFEAIVGIVNGAGYNCKGKGYDITFTRDDEKGYSILLNTKVRS